MSTYVIGDIHGRFDVLMSLIQAISYRPETDRLWFVGDLVNNGPRNAEVVRWVRDQGDRAAVVLGNHDLHMLAVASGASKVRKKDTFSDLLDAPDAHELLTWLRHRPMLHEDDGWLMVHAGLLPQWSLEVARACARDLEEALRGPDPRAFFTRMYGNTPARWSEDLPREDRLRLTVNALTRMRVCRRDGTLDFAYKGTLSKRPSGLVPWFRAPTPHPRGVRVCFGHWSALGLHREGVYRGLDSGCTWGRELTALRLEDEAIVQVDAG